MPDHHLLFGGDWLQFDHRHVATLSEGPRLVEHVGNAAGHAGRKIAASLTNYDDDAAGHVLAAVIADALDDSDRPGVAHAEPLAGYPAEVAFSCDCAVEHGVADDDRLLWLQLLRLLRRVDHDLSSRQALADVVVGIALELEPHPLCKKRAEALPGCSLELDVDRLVAKARVPVPLGDLARQHRSR